MLRSFCTAVLTISSGQSRSADWVGVGQPNSLPALRVSSSARSVPSAALGRLQGRIERRIDKAG